MNRDFVQIDDIWINRALITSITTSKQDPFSGAWMVSVRLGGDELRLYRKHKQATESIIKTLTGEHDER